MKGDMGSWWGMGFGGISMILFWGLVILAIAALAKWLTCRSRDFYRLKLCMGLLLFRVQFR